MEREDRPSYLRRRAQEARALSEQAEDDRVRMVHLEMAIRYEVLAGNCGSTDTAGDESDDVHV